MLSEEAKPALTLVAPRPSAAPLDAPLLLLLCEWGPESWIHAHVAAFLLKVEQPRVSGHKRCCF